MSVDEVNVNPSQEGALQSASVTDTDRETASAPAGTTPADSLLASSPQPELPEQLPPVDTDEYPLAHLYHLFPELDKFKLEPQEEDLAQLRLDFRATCRRSMQSSSAPAKEMLNFQRIKSPGIDAHCFQLSEKCIGMTPDLLLLLLESRELLLRFITEGKGKDPHRIEIELVTLGLQAVIEGRINPGGNV